MCGRFVFALSREELEKLTGTKSWINGKKFQNSYNVSPTKKVPIVRKRQRTFKEENKEKGEELVKEESIIDDGKITEEETVLHVMNWGLVPFWAHPESQRSNTTACFNARSETLLEKNMFKVPLKYGRRGVLVADGFYEWQNDEGQGKKTPYFISAEEGPLFMAVIYNVFYPKHKDEEEEGCFTIITVDASSSVAWLHDRMPALLSPAEIKIWLDTKNYSDESAWKILKPFEGNLRVQRASYLVNSTRNDGPDLLSFNDGVDPSKSQTSILQFFSQSLPATKIKRARRD
eukprot:jgi/Galph1/3968/GphlegSOOS_G2581.1